MSFKHVGKWLIELGGDGDLDSFLIEGDVNDVIHAVNKESGDDFTNEIENEDEWSMYGHLEISLEQAYIRVTPVLRERKKK